MSQILDVVAGVIWNERGEILLSSRPEGKAYAGYWEFAGGKVEAGETRFQALQREFAEELGITIHSATPWISKIHVYEHATVHLSFFQVRANEWSGELQAREAQQWAWQNPCDYTVSPMLPANASLLKALAIPQHFSGQLATCLQGENGYRLVPWALAEAHHPHVWLDIATVQTLGHLPEKDSVWVMVDSIAQFQAMQDADVILWNAHDNASASALTEQLQSGFSLPIVAYAPEPLAEHYASQWRKWGIHALIFNTEISMA